MEDTMAKLAIMWFVMVLAILFLIGRLLERVINQLKKQSDKLYEINKNLEQINNKTKL